jgi:hypothetical protein
MPRTLRSTFFVYERVALLAGSNEYYHPFALRTPLLRDEPVFDVGGYPSRDEAVADILEHGSGFGTYLIMEQLEPLD